MGSCCSVEAKIYVVLYNNKPLLATKYYDIAERAFLEGSSPDGKPPIGRDLLCYYVDTPGKLVEVVMHSHRYM